MPANRRPPLSDLELGRRSLLLAVPVGLVGLAGESLGSSFGGAVADAAEDLHDAAAGLARRIGVPVPHGSSTPSRRALERAVRSAISGRESDVAVSVLDRRTGAWWHHDGAALVRTGSVSKTLIVAAALRRARRSGDGLTERLREQARLAITLSDNAAATALYDYVGGHDGVADLARDLGMAATAEATPATHWGHTLTTADDLALMMLRLTKGSAATHRADDAHLLGLMGKVVDGQRWGVGTVRSGSVRVRVKNGWMAVDNPWVINSVGDVRGAGRDYVMALMQRAQPDEPTGIGQASRIGRAVFTSLAKPLR